MTRHGPTVLIADQFGPLISIGGAVSEDGWIVAELRAYLEADLSSVIAVRSDRAGVHWLRRDTLVQALARLESADSLGVAWSEAEAALPEGRRDILLMTTDKHGVPGYAATASSPTDPVTRGYRIVSTTAKGRKPDPTPVLALQALAAALREDVR